MRVLVLLFLLALPAMAAAQQEEPRDDRGYLTTLLEENLSGAGREVRITGFEGALSSRATMESLTIADDEGIWLRLSGVVLDWNRGALLRGRLEVNTLSAKRIELPRLPETGGGAPAPEAGEFALPRLPVAVNIASLEAERVALGAPVLGQAASFAVESSLSLEEGAGRARLLLRRLGDAKGEMTLAASYSNATGVLSLNVRLAEGEGGIAATLMNLPGRPALELSAKGTGPIADYGADIRLATDGEERLSGRVELEQVAQEVRPGPEPSRRLHARLGGDISALFAPDYRDFFGTGAALELAAWRDPAGGIRLDRFTITAQDLTVSGRAVIAPDGWPESFALEAAIGDAENRAVLLPLAGPPTRIGGAELALFYDTARGDGWEGRVTIDEVMRPGLQVASLRLSGSGQIGRALAGGIGGATGALDFRASGIAPADPALARALGEELRGRAEFDWRTGRPLSLPSFRLEGADYGLGGILAIGGLDTGLEAEGRVALRAGRLERFSGIAGQVLGGAADLDIRGSFRPLGGAFDLDIAGSTENLALGIPSLDGLLRGEGRLAASVRRDGTGIDLPRLEVETEGFSAEASGRLGSSAGALEFAARVENAARVIADLPGPAEITGRAARDRGDWEIDMQAAGPAGIRAEIAGTLAPDGSRAVLGAKGETALALVNPFIAPRSLSGRAAFDLSLDGPLSLSSVSGSVSATGARFADPELRLALEGVAAEASLSGARAGLEIAGALATGGRLELRGPVSLLPPYEADFSVALRGARLVDPELYEARLSAEIAVTGPLGIGARIGGRVDVEEAEIRVPSAGFGDAGALPGLTHVNEPSEVRATRARAGLLERESADGRAGPAHALDVSIDAPARIFVRGRGLDAELGGQLRLRGTTQEVVPDGRFELIRGRLDILGRRLTLGEGYAQLQGDFVPFIRLVADAEADGTRVFVIVEGGADNPEVRFRSEPELPEDEALALLLFGRSISQISPFQAARLAAAAAELAGRGGGGILGRIREGFGLDDLDVMTGAEGTTGVRAGKYLSENLYTDVEVSSDGTSEINLNLEVSPSVTVRGGAASDGDTGVGVFYERDY